MNFANNAVISPGEIAVTKRFNTIRNHAMKIIDKRIEERKPETKNVDVLDYYVDALVN